MIQLLTSNDILECGNLMSDTWNMDEYQGYERNEAYWLQGLINIINKQAEGNKNYLAMKSVDSSNNITAFMTCTVYHESYSGKPVMDVMDMIVDYTLGKENNAEDVISCFDYMVQYLKDNGGSDWRADTIHSATHAKAYVKFLDKNYNGYIRYGFRGAI